MGKTAHHDESSSLSQIAFVFLKLGTTAFGGPAAHIAMMDHEIVRKRGWISREQFLDLLSAANLIPGPNSTELAIHIGHHRGGWKGLIVAGTCFILPASLIVTLIAFLYVRYGSLPISQAVLYGVKPVIIAIVLQALWSLAKSAIKNASLAFLGGIAFAAYFLGANELLVLLLAGLSTLAIRALQDRKFWSPFLLFQIPSPLPWAPVTMAVTAAPVSLGKLFFFFLKVGSVLFGSGYVLLAFLRTDLVDHWHWLTEAQLLDAVAVGQFTPGPVFTTATFIGYLLAGPSGATLATLGIFLPAFLFVALTAPMIPKLRQSPLAAAVLDGVNVASLALMAVTSLILTRQALTDLFTVSLSMVSLVLLIRFKINSAWLVLLGGACGFLSSAILS